MVNDILKELNDVKGLDNVYLLEEEDKDIIRNLEHENNEGVFSCLEKKFTLVLTHDSSFRDPISEIVEKKNGSIIFPGVGFPELKRENVISGSPCKEVHEFLIKKFDLNLKDEASLIIGFD